MKLTILSSFIFFGFIVNCTVKSSSEPTMSKQNQIQVPTVLPSEGLSDKHKEEVPIYRTYDPGTRSTSPSAMAVFEDGSIYRYSDQLIKFEDGAMKMEEVDLKWRPEASITEEAIHAIKNLLDEFDPEESKANDSISGIEVSVHDIKNQSVFTLQGQDSPKNYMIFNKINQAISQGTIPSR